MLAHIVQGIEYRTVIVVDSHLVLLAYYHGFVCHVEQILKYLLLLGGPLPILDFVLPHLKLGYINNDRRGYRRGIGAQRVPVPHLA